MSYSSEAPEVGAAANSVGPAALALLATMPSDPTGISTFARYRWQAKMAVRTWLGTLTDEQVLAVVCEHVEDLTIVTRSAFRFAQLKTRDRGSWSVAKICAPGHAIAGLTKSFIEADAAGILDISQFEVWLEGPASEDRQTAAFFGDPASASASTRAKIRTFGLSQKQTESFLNRLAIHCQQPSRESIDAVIIRLIGAVWPAMTMDEVERLYELLVQAAEAAQADSQPPSSVRAAMIAARLSPLDIGPWGPIAQQSLTNIQLRSLCPPRPNDTDGDLIARAVTGQATLLELKLTRAGAGRDTVSTALLARAAADVAATTARAAGVMTVEAEEALDSRVLATAGSLSMLARSAAASSQRPGEQIFHTLMSRVADTAALDVDGLYGRDHRLVVGHLCGISDRCRYGWGLP